MRASTVKSSHGFVISAKKRAKSYICLSFLASFENVSSVALMHFNVVVVVVSAIFVSVCEKKKTRAPRFFT
jgi:hypothetical protein